MSSFITLSSNDDKILATKFTNGSVSENDPFSTGRQIAYDDGRTRAGAVEFAGSAMIDRFPHWEMVIVVEGALNFAFDASEIIVSAGGTLVIDKAAHFEIRADAPTKFVFLSVTSELDSNPEPAVLTLFDRNGGLFASPTLSDDILVSSAPTCRNHRMHVRDDIKVRAGLWDSTPYQRIFIEQQEHELMHITEGSVTFSDSDGHVAEYSAGETFLVPKGVDGKWTSTVHVAKIYAVVT